MTNSPVCTRVSNALPAAGICATGLCSFDRFPPPPAVAHRENAICRHISHFESYLVLDDAFL